MTVLMDADLSECYAMLIKDRETDDIYIEIEEIESHDYVDIDTEMIDKLISFLHACKQTIEEGRQ